MEGLDLSGLTDDQLIALAQACCVEAVRRSPAAGEAMQDMMLSEAEKVRIAKAATESERAAARARERERIAREAEAQERARTAVQERVRQEEAAQAAAERARQTAEDASVRAMGWLREAAALTERHPRDISIVCYPSAAGRRVLINPGSYRYTRQHLANYNVKTAEISTVAGAVKNKPALVELCARLSELLPHDAIVAGDTYKWSE